MDYPTTKTELLELIEEYINQLLQMSVERLKLTETLTGWMQGSSPVPYSAKTPDVFDVELRCAQMLLESENLYEAGLDRLTELFNAVQRHPDAVEQMQMCMQIYSILETCMNEESAGY